MTIFPNLMTRDEVDAMRRATRFAGTFNTKGKTRLETKAAKDTDADKAWRECVRLVDIRDKHKCRACKRKTVKTLTLCNEREEHHHLVRRRKVKALTMDERNVVTLCAECHGKVTRHELTPVQKARQMFSLDAAPHQSFLNADQSIMWLVTK